MGWNVQLPPAEYYSLESGYELELLINEIVQQPAVAIDTETDGLNLWKSLPYYWSLSWGSQGRDRRVTLPIQTIHKFSAAFNDIEKKWIFANAKFDLHMLANVGVQVKGHVIDTQVMHSLLYEEMPHGLKDMAKQLLGWRWTDFSETFGKIRSGYCVCGATKASHKNGGYCQKTACNSFRQIGPLDVLHRAERENHDLLVEYAANDAYGTWHVYKKLDAELNKEPTYSLYDKMYPHINTMADYFYKIEMPFTKVLYACERNGMKVNRQYLLDITPKIQQQINDLKKRIVEEAGYLINPNSDQQLREYFFEKLKLTPTRWTKGGKTGIKRPSVDSKFLESIAHKIPIAKLILELNAVEKQFSTYIVDMPKKLDPNDRVHMRLNQDVARTGRLSSSEPNMQNVTGGEKDIFELRNAFIADAGTKIICGDYSQLEMRLLAAASLEQEMCDIFRKNLDIHMGNASLVFGYEYGDMERSKKVDKFTKEQNLSMEDAVAEVFGADDTRTVTELCKLVKACLRARSDVKTIGFGLNYGMKEHTLATRMGCSVEEAKAKMEQYMARYPAVRQFFEEAVQEARLTGFAFTILGRRRRLTEIWSTNRAERNQAERQAVNMPIQGSAADVCKMAMTLIHEDNLQEKYDCRMQLQVHDELVFQCPSENVDIAKPIIKEWMEHPFPTDLAVDLTVEIGVGDTWGRAK